MTGRADHRKRVYDSIMGMQSAVENPTPLVRLNNVTPFRHAEVYAKLEWFNPFGSVKDRVASSLLHSAVESGELGPDTELVEPTSGNTGLGLAMVGNFHGYRLTTPLSSAIPEEKRTALRMFGARVEELQDELCPAPGAPEGAIARAHAIAAQPGFHMLNQYANRANPEAHYRTTGPEIWSQTDGEVTHFASSLGTCGTITGTGRFLKEQNPDVQVIGVHPNEGHDIPGVRSIRQLEQTEFFHPDEYDDLIEIKNQDAYDLVLRLNREESIPAGPSSGLALAGVFQTVPDDPGVRVVVMFPDSVFKYASSMARHLPEVAVTKADVSTTSRREALLDAMIENARANPELTIDVDTARRLLDDGAFVLDVRAPESYEDGHVQGAVNIPVLDLPAGGDGLPEDKETPILSICQRGNLSLSGVLFLKSLGYRNARSVDGGTNAWIERGYPVESRSGTDSQML